MELARLGLGVIRVWGLVILWVRVCDIVEGQGAGAASGAARLRQSSLARSLYQALILTNHLNRYGFTRTPNTSTNSFIQTRPCPTRTCQR